MAQPAATDAALARSDAGQTLSEHRLQELTLRLRLRRTDWRRVLLRGVIRED
jgi:hypothetical protein